jgi:ketosteroid isomerase-like protein
LKYFLATLLVTAQLNVGMAAAAERLQSAQPSDAHTQISTDAVAEVQHVIDEYHECVLTHDGNRLKELFLPNSLWLNVLTPGSYQLALANDPQAKQIRTGSYEGFAAMVSKSQSKFNPTHSNLHIHTDGTVASVFFDFVFYSDGKEQNRGSEIWVLVKGPEGWRIATISYSSKPPAV